MSETVNAILYEGHIAVFMPDERPIKHVVLESPSEKGMQGDLSWRYYMPESYTATLANENAKLRELVRGLLTVALDSNDYTQRGYVIGLLDYVRELGVEVES